jgi:hypothetical protein
MIVCIDGFDAPIKHHKLHNSTRKPKLLVHLIALTSLKQTTVKLASAQSGAGGGGASRQTTASTRVRSFTPHRQARLS